MLGFRHGKKIGVSAIPISPTGLRARFICRLSAEPGKITLSVYLRDIAVAMTDPAVEKITIQKSARFGFSTLLSSLIAYHFFERPAPVFVGAAG
jgi:phage terminase large subunit GpA-like protein